MEQVIKRKRGRPRKNTSLAETIQKIINEVKQKEEQEIKDIIREEKLKRKGEWDIPLSQNITFFDANLSYEATGYKPINDTQGLDFNPSWFTEARDTFKRTGHYCSYAIGSKAYVDFWTDQYNKCRNGMTVNGYTITGDNYFFLNFYQLANLDTIKAGQGRSLDFPSFYVAQYEWFHYLELCKISRKNAVLMKARGVGLPSYIVIYE